MDDNRLDYSFLPGTDILVAKVPDEVFEDVEEATFTGIDRKESLDDPQYASIRQEYVMPIPAAFQCWLGHTIDHHFEFHKDRYGIVGVEIDDLKIGQMWVNVMKKNDQHYPHMHEHSFYSFALYVRVEDNDAPFYFIKDNHGTRIEINRESQQHILIFPSQMIHTVYPKQTGGERISVSGNVLIDLNRE